MPAKKMTDDNHTSTEESTAAWGTTAFAPGRDIGLVARHTVGLIARENSSTRKRLWNLVSTDAPLDDILDELSSTGLKALPDFGIAQVEGDSVRVVARGRTVISAKLAGGGTHEVDASDVHTWVEEVVVDVAAITISLPTLDGDSDIDSALSDDFAVLAGSVPAQSLTRRFDVADEHAAVAESRWPGAAAPKPFVDDVAASEPELEEAHDIGVEMLPTDADSDQAEDVVEEPTPADSWFTSADEAGDAAIIPQELVADGPTPADSQPAYPQPAPPVLDVTADPVEYDAAPSDRPAEASGAPLESIVVVGSDAGPDRGLVTSIFDEDVADVLVGDDEPIPFASSELDDLQADAGQTASPALDDVEVYGVLSFSNGERINIDRSVLIGRNPKIGGAVDGGLPHIMKFDGPGQGLSRTHAEVRVEDGEIVLEDLHSTNGTEIQLPGQQRRRLRGGEPVAVVPGTLIDFGDELHCTVETAH